MLDLDSLPSNGWSKNKVGKSWFSIKLKTHPLIESAKTLWQLSRSFPEDCMDSAMTVHRLKKFQLFPNTEQKHLFRQMMGTYRFVYNFCIDRISNYGEKANYMAQRKAWTALLPDWVMKSCPPHTVYGAMMDACKNASAYFAKVKSGEKTTLPRCRKKTQKTCFLLGNAIANGNIYPRRFGKILTKESLPHNPMDSRLLWECRKWFVLIPSRQQTLRAEKQGSVCSIDPGVRTFLAYYSPEQVGKIGEGSFSRIASLARSADNLKSRLTKAKPKKKRRMKQAFNRLSLRIRNLVKDLHYQSIKYLFEEFDCVICPLSDFHFAVKKTSRKIRSRAVRSLLTFSFASFVDRLCHKAALLGKRVILVNEAYTSKTANWTGEVKDKLGSAKIIKSANLRVDRDLNGAFGIFLKGVESSSLDIFV